MKTRKFREKKLNSHGAAKPQPKSETLKAMETLYLTRSREEREVFSFNSIKPGSLHRSVCSDNEFFFSHGYTDLR